MKRICRRTFFACLTGLILCMISFLAAAEEDTLILPLSLDYIKEAAFSGVAAEKVVVPEGTKEIHKKAFSNSALTEVVLPSSLTYIADDAFEGCPEGLRVLAEENTYAYDWADDKGYIYGPLKELVVELPIDTAYEIDITNPFQIPYHTVPRNAPDRILWKSLNPEIGTVDENGLVTPLKTGTMGIQAYKSNGVHLITFYLNITGDFYRSEGLEFTLTSDGTGYRVVNCTTDPERILIPAAYNGLPVVGFEPGAFKNCTKLTNIALEDGHTVLYIENMSLYADLPQKTLLCYPGSYRKSRHYYVPNGTQAIAAYAFAHFYLDYLTIPEGVISIGDCAFYGLPWGTEIFMPDSLTDFGNYLFQNQKSNGVFTVKSWESPAVEYANKNQIPVRTLIQRTPEPTIVPTPTPLPTPMPDIPSLDDSNIVTYNNLYYLNYINCNIRSYYDISHLEGENVSEVRLEIQDQWRDMVYYPEYAPQTGLYGAGYTGQEAIIRGYDKYGNQVGAKKIEGDFIFTFDGAYTLGISGGKNTKLSVVPTKPIFITQPGRYPVRPTQWHSFTGGNIYQHYIIAMPRGMIRFDHPDHVGIYGYQTMFCASNIWTWLVSIPHDEYIMCNIHSIDGSRVNMLDQITLIFDSLSCLLNNEKLAVYASSLPEKSENLGENIYRIFDATRNEVLSGHYPKSVPINKVYININGEYPATFKNNIDLNEFFYQYDDDDALTIAHESIHAIDHGIRDFSSDSPVPHSWLEGRAEYISMETCDRLNIPCYNAYYDDGKEFDWSFLSEADRSDFFRYYYYSTNRYTIYTVGYYFYDYLIDTYGSNIGERVMNNIATMPYDTNDKPGFFKKCVEAATEVGVFQRFVNDVVIPSGT